MTRLLRIDSSARTQGSHSREMADLLTNSWLDAFPQDEMISRDLATQAVPHISANTIEAYHTTPQQHDAQMKQASALSEQLIAELLAADVLIFSVPMYNFSIPSVLKAYIDHIVRAGFSFDYTPEKGLFGLLKNKQAILCIAVGSVISAPAMSALDHLQPYLQSLLRFLGVEHIDTITIEGSSTDPQALRQSKIDAQEIIANIIKQQEQRS